MIPLLLAIPTLAGALALATREASRQRALLLLAVLAHFALVVSCWYHRPAPWFGGWLALDELGLWVLTITSVLFLATTLYALNYLPKEDPGRRPDFEDGTLFENAPHAVFVASLAFFLAALTLVALSQHFAVLWVAVEATTLASAPLIFFHRHRRSLEATWKYLVVCSVGIALALVGTFFLAVATARQAHLRELVLGELLAHPAFLDPRWLELAFVFALVGYGTKMGLAPWHAWLPDAHAEAPSLVSALLSGALLNAAFLAILRFHQVLKAAGLGAFSQSLLLYLGLLSMLVAASFLLIQVDYKQLLAYSSVEHMGVLALGAGLGRQGVFAAAYHAWNHSLAKAALFLLAGNILARYKTKAIPRVAGLSTALPFTGALWVAGFFAITGAPPFGLFVSELAVAKACFAAQKPGAAAVYLLALLLAFVGLGKGMLATSRGESAEQPQSEALLAWLPSLLLFLASVLLGLLPPAAVLDVAHELARLVGVS
jgi:hydrogenase-4 component F